MPERTEDLRIQKVRPLVPPAILHEEIPASDCALKTVVAGREAVVDSLTGKSDRLVCVVGPCSIHGAVHVTKAADMLEECGMRRRMMVDCSHGNSEKDHTRQSVVAKDAADQIAGGSRDVFGVMIESNLVAGRQDFVAGEETYGQSITDACIDVVETGKILSVLAEAIAQRRG